MNRKSSVVLALLIIAAQLLAVGSQAAEPELPPLCSPPGNRHLPGKFIWGDLVTSDVAAARRFYGQLLGWTFRVFGSGPEAYTIAMSNGRPLCGMVQAPPRVGASTHPQWVGYLSVSSVRRAQKAVLKAGGKELLAPRKLPRRGKQAVFTDREGAVFGVMSSSSGDPRDFLAEPGEWIWIQLLSREAHEATEFYRAVGGYEIVENSGSQRQNDYLLVSEGFARAAVMQIPKDHPEIRPAWLPFARVTNITESVAEVRKLGGSILVAPKPEIFNGKAAVVADPTGAAIGLLEWDIPASRKGEQP